jgi:hypothetical protein
MPKRCPSHLPAKTTLVQLPRLNVHKIQTGPNRVLRKPRVMLRPMIRSSATANRSSLSRTKHAEESCICE